MALLFGFRNKLLAELKAIGIRDKMLARGDVEMDLCSMKKLYNPPMLTELTEEQANKLVADRKKCTEEEAAKLLRRLRKPLPKEGTSRERRRSA